jgi:ABC-type multidrug transport system ATPase subunit
MIRLEGVSRRFGSREVLQGVTLHVGPGETVALVGPNGAGKSTTLRVLAGLVRPTSGSAWLDAVNVATLGPRARCGLGYLPQKLGMPGDTVVRDLLTLLSAIRKVPISQGERAIAAMRLGHRFNAKLSELSGGEVQRIMLALATMGEITTLLLDEPSISLDSEGADEVRETIRAAAKKGSAVLFASHHLSDVSALADRIAVMVDGRIAAVGTLRELARMASVPGDSVSPDLPPIEKVYQTLVTRARRGETIPALRALGSSPVRGAA